MGELYLSDIDLEIMRRSQYLATGGIDLFWQYWSAPKDALAHQGRDDLIGRAMLETDAPLKPDEFVPLKPISWAKDIAHGDDSDFMIIGGVGCGKTLNMVLIAGYYCCMMPNFRYLGTAPIAWQADLSYKEFLTFALDWNNTQGRERRIIDWIENVRLRPHPMIEFVNGSSMEFKSLDKDATSIMTWSGDMAVVDQAEDPSVNLEMVMGNLGSRLRGQVGGRSRLGKLGLMANSAYNPVLWETFDKYESDPAQLAMLLTSYDNPYLTQRQLVDIERRFRDKDEAKRLMYSERPLPKGKEFTQELIVKCQSDALDGIMDDALSAGLEGFIKKDSRTAGIYEWALPPRQDHLYIMAGDPGQANPPYRNSPCIMVFDVTDFPRQPATLAAFYWIYGYGSYWPFINTMTALHYAYNPYYAAFDSTGTQKAFDDLSLLDQDRAWVPINNSGMKMHMVLCLKVLMGRGFVQIPKSLYSVWNQLLMWHMPDKQLRQDIASTMFMIGYALNQILPLVEGDNEVEDFKAPTMDRWSKTRIINKRRSVRSL
jgi:hypothetical protein